MQLSVAHAKRRKKVEQHHATVGRTEGRLIDMLSFAHSQSKRFGDRNLGSKLRDSGQWRSSSKSMYDAFQDPVLTRLWSINSAFFLPDRIAGIPTMRIFKRRLTRSQYLKIARLVLTPLEYRDVEASLKQDKKGHAPKKEKLRAGLGKLRRVIKARHIKSQK